MPPRCKEAHEYASLPSGKRPAIRRASCLFRPLNLRPERGLRPNRRLPRLFPAIPFELPSFSDITLDLPICQSDGAIALFREPRIMGDQKHGTAKFTIEFPE